MPKMADIKKHLEKIENDIHNDSLKKLCIDIVLSVTEQRKKLNRELFKFKNIADHVDRLARKEELLEALGYLSGESNRFLETKFQFVDDFGNSYIVPIREIEKSMNSGIFEHPETGNTVSNFKNKIYIVYMPHEKQ